MYFSDSQSYIDERLVPFESAIVHSPTYYGNKKDVQTKNYKKWFNDDVINFYKCWSMRNTSSKYVRACEIIDTMVTFSVQNFFAFDRKPASSNSNYEHLGVSIRQIHLYLKLHADLLSKKLFFLLLMMKINTGGDGLLSIHGTRLSKLSKSKKI